jgi:hypothetical protein
MDTTFTGHHLPTRSYEPDDSTKSQTPQQSTPAEPERRFRSRPMATGPSRSAGFDRASAIRCRDGVFLYSGVTSKLTATHGRL